MDWITCNPAGEGGGVVAEAVVGEFGGVVIVLGAEAEGEGVGLGAGLDDGVAVGVVFVMGNHGSIGIHKVGDVTVGVAEGEGVGGGKAGLEEAADAAGALEGLGEVEAPEVGSSDGAGATCQEKVGLGNVGVWSAGGEGGLAFLEEVPAIIEIGAALDVVPRRVAQIITPDELATGDAATLVVIHILDKGGAEVGRGGTGFDEAVLGVPDVNPIAVSGHIAVGVVGEGGGVGGDGGVLVEGVGGVVVGEAVFDGLLAVADGVVGVGVGVGTHSRIDKFGANIVGKGIRGQGRIGGVETLGAATDRIIFVGEGGDDVGAESVGDEGFVVAEGVVFVGDGGAGGGGVAGEEVGAGEVGVGEDVGGGVHGGDDGGEAARRVVSIHDIVTFAKGNAGFASEGVVGAGEGGAVGEVFGEERSGGVGVGAGAEDVGDGEGAAEAVVGVGDVGGGVGVGDGEELAEGVVGVVGGDAAGPEAFGEAAGGIILIGRSEAVGVELVGEEAGGFVVEPAGGVGVGVGVAPGVEGGEAAVVVVDVADGISGPPGVGGAALDVVPSRVAQIITPDELAAGDAATLVVIHILDKGGAEVGRGGTGFDEAVLGVPDVSPNGLIFNVHELPIPLCPLIAPFCLTPFHTNVLIAAWIMYEI